MLSAADRSSFARLERSLGGRSGIALAPLGRGGRREATGTLRTGVAWSTSKVPLAMAVIAAGGGSAQRSTLHRAITASDNAAAERLWASIGGGPAAAAKATRQLRAAGDRRTVVESRRLRARFTPFGQTAWELADQAAFVAGMPCTAPGRNVLALMGRVVPAQRWGLSAVGARTRLKGGWGPGAAPGVSGGYLDRQMGVLTLRGRQVGVAIATVPADGRHETGTSNLTRIARWAAAHVAVRPLPSSPACGSGPLAGTTVVLDPGHNGGNARAPEIIKRRVPIGQGRTKACNTTGTATEGGYSEAAYAWDVALRARAVLRRRGATVVLTRSDNRSVGPCIDERARIANRAHADAAVSIHADGGPKSGHGFHVIEPAWIGGLTDDVFAPSHRLALTLRGAFRRTTGEPYANYAGRDGISRRSDVGALRLADVPSVLIETGNMRSARDAARMTRPSHRARVAGGIAGGVQRFLRTP